MIKIYALVEIQVGITIFRGFRLREHIQTTTKVTRKVIVDKGCFILMMLKGYS